MIHVDSESVMDLRNSVFCAATPKSVVRISSVSCDLGQPENLVSSLIVSGIFDKNVPTAWLAEGLFMYLTKEQVNVLLSEVESVSAAGSTIISDFMSEEYWCNHLYFFNLIGMRKAQCLTQCLQSGTLKHLRLHFIAAAQTNFWQNMVLLIRRRSILVFPRVTMEECLRCLWEKLHLGG